MNWIIRKLEKLTCHTCLNEVLKPIYSEIENYNWLLTDLEFNGYEFFNDLPVDHEQQYFVLGPEAFKKLVDAKIQCIWGSILAIPSNIEIKVDENNLPYTEGNPLI